MKIVRSEVLPSMPGPSDWFTGQVRIDPLFAKEDATHGAGALVTFEPGARTAWHTHPAGSNIDCAEWHWFSAARRWPNRGNPPR